MQIYNFEQRTPEWYAIRLGKLTASKASVIAAQGKGLDTLCLNCASEILANRKAETISTPAMEQGKTLEDNARFAFEAETGLCVEEVGFCEYSAYVGCSPDGFVGDNALIEIKCPQDNTYTKFLFDGEIKSEHYWQMQMQMLITERALCYYVVYNPNFEQSICIKQVAANVQDQQKLQQGLDVGVKKITKILSVIEEKKGKSDE